MTNPEWGSRHICQKCNRRYWDLKRVPAVCPTCETETIDNAPKLGEYWVYFSKWDISEIGLGPFKAIIHKRTCDYVLRKKGKFPIEDDENIYARYLDANGNYKHLHDTNYWVRFRTEKDAINFAKWSIAQWEEQSEFTRNAEWLIAQWRDRSEFKRCAKCFNDPI